MIEDIGSRLWKGAGDGVETARLAVGSLPDRLPVPIAIVLISVTSIVLWGLLAMAVQFLGRL